MIVDGSTSTLRSCIILHKTSIADPVLAVPADTEQNDLNG
jgi:hypothetical protein